MTSAAPIKLFQFPRMFAVPNLSPFCCKLETWLRIAGVPYQVVDTTDPRKGPRGKVPFIEDAGVRIADSSLIVEHLTRTRNVDPDARLGASERAIPSPIRDFLDAQPKVVSYAERMRARFFPELVPAQDTVTRQRAGHLAAGAA